MDKSRMTAGISSQHDFSKNPVPSVPRSQFDLRWRRTTTIDAGIVYPGLVIECLPGDTYSATITAFLRFLSLKNPIMSDLFLNWFAFFTPNRIVWDNWVRLQGERPTPESSTDFVVPWLTQSGSVYQFASLSLGDYFGLPVEVDINANFWHISALPFRCYNMIYNEWFRDQNYQNPLPFHTGDGPDDVDDYALFRRAKKHDYFTSALPWPQKGPDVLIPWEGMAPVYGDNGPLNFVGMGDGDPYTPIGSSGSIDLRINPASTMDQELGIPSVTAGFGSGMVADVAAVSASLNALRMSISLQQAYELDARGGTRYIEALPSRFGAGPTDARLQRPEYIGGGSHAISVSSVPQTSPSTDDSPQARLAAYGIGGFHGGIHYSCQEHGYIHILFNVNTPLIYQNQLHRMWTRSTRFDFAEPIFAHIGDQPVFNYEMYFDPTDVDGVWGYQGRYDEYRYGGNMVTGLMRDGVAGSLSAWNLALAYDTAPVHDGDWLMDDPPIDRVIAVPAQPAFLLDFIMEGTKTSPLPVYGIPGLRRF